MSRAKALIAWSSGKDSAFALHVARHSLDCEIVGALTTITDTFRRVSIHGVREEVLRAQSAAAGLPLRIVPIPYPCPNEIYEQAMASAMASASADGVTHIIFGDLFLSDIRAYREQKLAGTGIVPVFPLWGRDTAALAREMIVAGMEATIAAVDCKVLPAAFAGRAFDVATLAALPPDVDPCGENGEFHTCVSAGPMFAQRISLQRGDTITRDGIAYADLLLA
ncbi:MAG: ATP-binding protein [Pseudolabrys sp.]